MQHEPSLRDIHTTIDTIEEANSQKLQRLLIYPRTLPSYPVDACACGESGLMDHHALLLCSVRRQSWRLLGPDFAEESRNLRMNSAFALVCWRHVAVVAC